MQNGLLEDSSLHDSLVMVGKVSEQLLYNQNFLQIMYKSRELEKHLFLLRDKADVLKVDYFLKC